MVGYIKNRVPEFHTWTSILALIVVLTFLLPPFYGCETKGEFLVSQMVKASEGATISSSDEGIALEIPPGALSEDTTVTLGIVPEANWANDIQAIEPVGYVYRLEPDGLELDKPATLTIRLESDSLMDINLPDGAFPACIVLTSTNGGEWDMLRNPATSIDINTGDVLVSGEATHFSRAVVRKMDMAVAINPSSVQKLVKETWPATVTVFNLKDTGMFEGDSMNVYQINYLAAGKVNTYGIPSASSFLLEGGESKTTTPQPTFECSEKGTGKYGAMVMAKLYLAEIIEDLLWGPGTLFEDPDKVLWENEMVEITVWGDATCGAPVATPAPVSEGAPEETKEQVTCGLTFNPDPSEFGDVCVGASKQMAVTVTNPCDFDITVAEYKWPDAPFKVVSTVPRNLTLAKGQSYDYTIEFTPLGTETYTTTFRTSFEYEHDGEWDYRVSSLDVSGTGVVCEQQVSALWADGNWQCTPTTAGQQLDFQILVRDLTNGQAPIAAVVLYIDGEKVHSSGAISTIEYPPPPGMLFRRITSPGPHTIRIVAVNTQGQTLDKNWEVYCGGEPPEQPPVSQPPETGQICPICDIPFDLCPH
jgi:hypothetical protein